MGNRQRENTMRLKSQDKRDMAWTALGLSLGFVLLLVCLFFYQAYHAQSTAGRPGDGRASVSSIPGDTDGTSPR